MPGFVKTPADEKRWSKAKKAAGKSTPEGSESYWKLANYIFHKSADTEEGSRFAEEIKKSLFISPSSGMAASEKTSVPSVKVPSATKMPKAKSMPDAMDKPSKFFKSETMTKHPTLCKLRDFLEKHKGRK